MYFPRIGAVPSEINFCLSVMQVVNHPAFDTVWSWIEQNALSKAAVIYRIKSSGEIESNQDGPVGWLLLVEATSDISGNVVKGSVGRVVLAETVLGCLLHGVSFDVRQEDSFHDLGSGAEKADWSPILTNRVVFARFGKRDDVGLSPDGGDDASVEGELEGVAQVTDG